MSYQFKVANEYYVCKISGFGKELLIEILFSQRLCFKRYVCHGHICASSFTARLQKTEIYEFHIWLLGYLWLTL